MFHPTTFGKYFLTRRIAVGGMAEVFAAKLYGADGFEKDLVIKQILPQYARDEEFVQSFVAEAKIAVSLTHANIVSIYELGRVDGTYFIAMEFVDGMDIFALLDTARRQEDPLDPGQALLIVEEVARGLDYAHRKLGPDGLPLGLVHRDLNPRNVLVSREGDVKILDFGIAKTASKAAAMPKTRQGVVKGTTGYMSPEQATARPIDLRTDIYQAGLLLFEALTGKALFWRPEDHVTRELMRKHEIIAPSRVVAGIPPEVDELVLTCLQVRADDRYQTAAELAAATARVRAIHFPSAGPLPLGEWVTRLVDRDRAASRVHEDDIPATADFSEVISRAIEKSITGHVETIATRAPSGVFRLPPRPSTGSQPLDADSITGDLVPMAPGAVMAGSPLTDEGALEEETTLMPPLPASLGVGPSEDGPTHAQLSEDLARPRRRSRWLLVAMVLAALVGAAVAALGLPMAGGAPSPAPTEAPPTPPEAEPTPSAGKAEAAEPSSTEAPEPAVVEAPPQPRAPAEDGRVDFGSRPCPSRVVVDGRRLETSTPVFGQLLAAGSHRVMMVADGCAPVPGSLEPRRPRLSRMFELPAGAKLKVVADFESGRIDVRGSRP